VDVVSAFDACLHSVWLLPVLAVMIAADGPAPVLPSETLLVSALAAAFGTGDVVGVVGLLTAALIGSIVGDLLIFGLGRSSHRFLPRAAHAECSLSRWARANLFRRPVVVLVGARMLPAGRLVGSAAAGRVGLPVRRYLPGSLASSTVWCLYMLSIGLLLGPFVGGNPLMSLAAGAVMAVVTAGGFALAQRVRTALRTRAARPAAAPATVPTGVLEPLPAPAR
jgi:membrane-associated protein